jgi:hypothetical protein
MRTLEFLRNETELWISYCFQDDLSYVEMIRHELALIEEIWMTM